MIGPSRKLQRGPPAFWARRRANVRRSAHSRSRACSWATKSGRAETGWNIGPRWIAGRSGWADAAGHQSTERRPVARPRRRGTGCLEDRCWPATPAHGPDREPGVSFRAMSTPRRAPRSRSAFAAAFLSLLFPGLGHAYAGAYTRALAFAALPLLAHRPRRRDPAARGQDGPAGVPDQPDGPGRAARRQRRLADLPDRGGGGRVAGRPLPQRRGRVGRRAPRSCQAPPQPPVDRRAPRRPAGDGRRPPRGRPLRHDGPELRQLRLPRGEDPSCDLPADSPDPGASLAAGDTPEPGASGDANVDPTASADVPPTPAGRQARAPRPPPPPCLRGTARSGSTSCSSAATSARATRASTPTP